MNMYMFVSAGLMEFNVHCQPWASAIGGSRKRSWIGRWRVTSSCARRARSSGLDSSVSRSNTTRSIGGPVGRASLCVISDDCCPDLPGRATELRRLSQVQQCTRGGTDSRTHAPRLSPRNPTGGPDPTGQTKHDGQDPCPRRDTERSYAGGAFHWPTAAAGRHTTAAAGLNEEDGREHVLGHVRRFDRRDGAPAVAQNQCGDDRRKHAACAQDRTRNGGDGRRSGLRGVLMSADAQQLSASA